MEPTSKEAGKSMEEKACSAFVNELNNNAVFQLSLASKELFHSNFLYWLAVSETDFFNKLLKKLGIGFELDLRKHIVCREYNHFDFCICEKYTKKAKKKEIQNDDTSNDDYVNDKNYEVSDTTVGIGRVLLVLENKFKSIATKEQLEQYTAKVKNLKDNAKTHHKDDYMQSYKKEVERQAKEIKKYKEQWKGNNEKKQFLGKNEPHFIDLLNQQNQIEAKYEQQRAKFEQNYDKSTAVFLLLTLAENFSEKDDIKGWKIITYQDYAEKLGNVLGVEKATFTQQLIDKYITFISTFSKGLNNKLSELDDKLTISWIFATNDFTEIRCNDIWQKVALHKVLEYLKIAIGQNYKIDLNANLTHLQDSYKEPDKQCDVALEVSMSHATGMLAGRRLLHKNYYIEVELQGNALCWGIGFYPKCRSNYIVDYTKKDKLSWKNDARTCLAALPRPDIDDNHWGKELINDINWGKELSGESLKEYKLCRYQNPDNSGFYYKKIDVSNKSIEEVVKFMCQLLTVNCSGHQPIEEKIIY